MDRKTILLVTFPVVILLFAATPVKAVLEATNVNNNFSSSDFMTVAQNIANFIISFVTVLGIIFIIWGAIQYVVSGGDEEAIQRAKNTIVYALVGLFIAAMAYALENLVLTTLIG